MAAIRDQDVHIFKEASIPAITNFTDDEVNKVGELAKALHRVLQAARNRLLSN